MVLCFYLRRGELPGCLLRLQRGVSLNAHRLALLYAREASKQVTKAGVAVISAQLWGEEELSVCLLLIRTICLSPVDKLISDDNLFLFLIHSSDLQEVFCLAMLIIAQPSCLALNIFYYSHPSGCEVELPCAFHLKLISD